MKRFRVFASKGTDKIGHSGFRGSLNAGIGGATEAPRFARGGCANTKSSLPFGEAQSDRDSSPTEAPAPPPITDPILLINFFHPEPRDPNQQPVTPRRILLRPDLSTKPPHNAPLTAYYTVSVWLFSVHVGWLAARLRLGTISHCPCSVCSTRTVQGRLRCHDHWGASHWSSC